MNLESLSPLEGRWPNDTVLVKKDPGMGDAIAMINTPTGENFFQDKLRIDEQDSSLVAGFAANNNLTYSRSASIQTGQYGSRVPAWLGAQTQATNPMFAHEVTGTLYGYTISFCVAYVPGGTRSSITPAADKNGLISVGLEKKSIIRVKLPKVFPQMVLDSNKNDTGYISTIPSSFKENQKMTLEGNFASYFDFYSPVGLQVNTLTLLAPNFMQLIMESAATFDVEFYGDELILVSHDPIYTPTVMKVALTALEAQLSYMDRLLQSWNYQPVSQPFDELEKTYLVGATIKAGKLRIKPAMLLGIIFVGFILFAVLIIAIK